MMPQGAVQLYTHHLHTDALKAGWSLPGLPHHRQSSCVFGGTLLKRASHDAFAATLPLMVLEKYRLLFSAAM